MSQTHELHREAMSLLDEAIIAGMRGDNETASHLKQQAFIREREAAELLANRLDLEPTRSILYKGAAVLALECGLQNEAEQLALRGLQGSPPPPVFEQLQSTLTKATGYSLKPVTSLKTAS
jgi:hypothetical protein